MLNLIVCDENREDAVLLTKILKKSLADTERDAKIVYSVPERLKSYAFQEGQSYIVFMELVFPGSGADGIALAESLRRQNSDLAISFITSHVEYMPYVLKGSITPSAFLRKPARLAEVSEILSNIVSLFDDVSADHFFMLNLAGETCRVPCSQILYFEALQKKINLHTIAKRYSFYSSLSSIEADVGDKGFVRCHNSFIINKDKVTSVSFGDMMVKMENDAFIPISRTFKQNMRDVFSDG